MRAAERVLARMLEVSAEGQPWERVSTSHGSPTIRLDRTHETPEYQLGEGFGRWPEPTYQSHTFLTLVTGKVILGRSAAPWVGRTDSYIPFWLAEAILADEDDLGQDWPRMLALKDERKRARS